MNTMYLDIETVPADSDKHAILQALHEKKLKEGHTTKTFEEVIEDTGLNGAFGRICCISYAINDSPVQTLCSTEISMLRDFWALAKEIDLFVGFNILDFDLRFIWQRSVIHQIKPPREIDFSRHKSSPIYDIMYEWSRWSGGVGSRVGLDALARALDLPSPKEGPITGRTVAKAYLQGRLPEICEYCERDVTVTRLVYKRITFS